MDPSFLFIILLAHFIGLPPFSGAGFCSKYTTQNVTQFCDDQSFNSNDLYLDTYKASTRRTRCFCYFTSERNTTITLSTKDYPSNTTTSCNTTSRIEYRIFGVPGTSDIICGYTVKQIVIRRGQSLGVTFYNELANLENYCLSVKTATAAHKLRGKCFSDTPAADTSTNPVTTSKQFATKQSQEEAYTSVTTNHQGKDTTTTADSTTTVTTTDVTSPGDTTTTGASKGYTTRGSTSTVGISSGTLTGHTTSSASPGGTTTIGTTTGDATTLIGTITGDATTLIGTITGDATTIGTTTGDATTIGTTTSVNVLQGTSFKYRLPLTILIPLICVGLLFCIVVITVVAVCIRRRNKNKGNLKDENVKRDSDNGDEMVYNELYHTFGSNGRHVSGDACAGAEVPVHAIELNTGGLGEYAEVSIQHTDTDSMKKIDENNCDGDQNKDCGPVYAMPDKTKKQDAEQGPIYAMPNKQEKNEKVQDGTTPIYAVPDKKKDK